MSVSGLFSIDQGAQITPVITSIPPGATQVLIPIATFGSISGTPTFRQAMLSQVDSSCYDISVQFIFYILYLYILFIILIQFF